jgi:hypothetical protein
MVELSTNLIALPWKEGSAASSGITAAYPTIWVYELSMWGHLPDRAVRDGTWHSA